MAAAQVVAVVLKAAVAAVDVGHAPPVASVALLVCAQREVSNWKWVAVAKPSRAAICLPLSKLYAAQANAKRVVMAAAMAAATVAHQPRPRAALAASLTQCAPALT